MFGRELTARADLSVPCSCSLLFDTTAPLVLEELAYCGDVHGYR